MNIGKEDSLRFSLEELDFTFRYNVVSGMIEVNGEPMTNRVWSRIHHLMLDTPFSNNQIDDAIVFLAEQNEYDPIADYLTASVWDGEDYIGKLASYFTTKNEHIADVLNDPDYTDQRSVFEVWLTHWMIGAVGKALNHSQNPMLVLDGPQGCGKSYFASWLASDLPDYFVEGPILPDNKDFRLRMTSTFLQEVFGLGGIIRDVDRKRLKSVITQEQVKERRAYGRQDESRPVRCSFIGTVNIKPGFLGNPSCSQRFLSCTIESVNFAYSQDIDPQDLWAQAYYLWKQDKEHAGQLSSYEVRVREVLNRGYEVESHTGNVLKRLYEIRGNLYKGRYLDKECRTRAPFTPSAEIVRDLEEWGVKSKTPRQLATEVAKELGRMGVARGKSFRVNGVQVRGYFGVSRRSGRHEQAAQKPAIG